MQVLILYYSRGGNTKKLAAEVARGVESTGLKAVLRNTQEVTKDDFLLSAGVIAGSPVYFGTMAADLKRVIDEFVGLRLKMENKVGAAFRNGRSSYRRQGDDDHVNIAGNAYLWDGYCRRPYERIRPLWRWMCRRAGREGHG